MFIEGNVLGRMSGKYLPAPWGRVDDTLDSKETREMNIGEVSVERITLKRAGGVS